MCYTRIIIDCYCSSVKFPDFVASVCHLYDIDLYIETQQVNQTSRTGENTIVIQLDNESLHHYVGQLASLQIWTRLAPASRALQVDPAP